MGTLPVDEAFIGCDPPVPMGMLSMETTLVDMVVMSSAVAVASMLAPSIMLEVDIGSTGDAAVPSAVIMADALLIMASSPLPVRV